MKQTADRRKRKKRRNSVSRTKKNKKGKQAITYGMRGIAMVCMPMMQNSVKSLHVVECQKRRKENEE